MPFPCSRAKASLDYHPENHPFGLTATAILRRRLNINQGWGRGMAARSTANIRSVDLAGRWFLESQRHHIISVRLEKRD